MAELPGPRRSGRRAVLGTLAVAAVGAPIAAAASWAHANTVSAAGKATRPLPGTGTGSLLWTPSPAKDGLRAFEGVEADRTGIHPGRRYVYVEGDHWRFDISTDDRDSTGGGDRQRTETRGMVAGGKPVKMHNNETWRISWELFMPASLHGTSRFTHIFQTKTPKTNAGPWVTVSLTRGGSGELLRVQADSTSGNPAIGSCDLSKLRDHWITVQLTLKIGPKGTVGAVVRNGTGPNAPVVLNATRGGINIPDQGDYVRPKWGIYRSVQSAKTDVLNTYLLTRNYQASRIS